MKDLIIINARIFLSGKNDCVDANKCSRDR